MKSLALALAVTGILLYGPGYIWFRALRFSRLVSVSCAPLFAFGACAVIPIAYSALRVGSTAVSVGALMAALCIAALVFRWLSRRRGCVYLDVRHRSTATLWGRSLSFEWAALGLYVASGVAVCWFVWVSNFSHADSFICRWDNQTHLNMIRSFVDSGQWSSLSASLYLASDPQSIPMANPVSFYPSGWNDLVAFVCSVGGLPVTVCVNAVNIFLVATVFPSGVFLLLKILFPADRRTIAAGVFICPAFTSFPWQMLLKGPYYPNMASLVLMLLVASTMMLFVESGLVKKRPLSFAVFVCGGLVTLALVQTNALFALLLFFSAYACHIAYHRAAGRFGSRCRGIAVGACASAAVLGAMVAVWSCAYHLPFLAGVVHFEQPAGYSGMAAAVKVLLLDMGHINENYTRPEYALAVLVAIGLAVCLRRRSVWVLLPPLVMGAAYVLSLSTTGELRHLVGGFWYTDPVRLSACYEIFVIPLAAMGFSWISSFAWAACQRGSEARRRSGLGVAAVSLISIVLVVLLYVPSVPLGWGKAAWTAIGAERGLVKLFYGSDATTVYDTAERSFVEKVKAAVPEGALVINQPHDGSVFSYGVNGLNVYYRKSAIRNYNDVANTIRTGLSDYASDPDVRAAVDSTGAEYVLLLDAGAELPDRTWLPQYKSAYDYWTGVNSVNDETPGFHVILSEGDMRLYRIA